MSAARQSRSGSGSELDWGWRAGRALAMDARSAQERLQDSAPLVRAPTDSLTCGLLQAESAGSSATLSAFTATKRGSKGWLRLSVLNRALWPELLLLLYILDSLKFVQLEREAGSSG